MSHACVVVDIAGFELTPEDRELLQHPQVVGVILFARNYSNLLQLKALTKSIHQVRDDLIIYVDQEGGRVQRFVEGFTKLPSMQHWGDNFCEHQESALTQLAATVQTMVIELQRVGIDASLAPVLDLDYGHNEVIGHRSFHSEADVVITLARQFIQSMHDNGMPVVGKHFPGHGAVTADSHKELPRDDRPFELISANDMQPFIALCHELDAIMPAHVVYSQVDDKPAGFSSVWLQTILRQRLGFKGVIISDDLSMAATSTFGSPSDRAWLALEAGCDIILVCNDRDAASEVVTSVERFNLSSSHQRIMRYQENTLAGKRGYHELSR